MLSLANEKGQIQGVVPHLVPSGLTHLQYADDTLILIQHKELDVANLKFLLMCFEDMSGLKINYHKSEVIVMGATLDEQRRVASMLNDKLGTIPFISLGLPVSDRKLTVEQSKFLVQKLTAKVEPWVGRFLSSGGRLILTNSCLDNLPIYIMGFFLLQESVHANTSRKKPTTGEPNLATAGELVGRQWYYRQS